MLNGEVSGWRQLFGDPPGVIAAINGFGFKNSDYHAAKEPPPAYISTGTLIDLAPSSKPSPNCSGAYVYGSHREWVDEVRFKLNINDPDSAAPALARFVEILRDLFAAVDHESVAVIEEAVIADEDGEYAIGDANLSVRHHNFRNNVVGAHSLNMVFHRRSAPLQD